MSMLQRRAPEVAHLGISRKSGTTGAASRTSRHGKPPHRQAGGARRRARIALDHRDAVGIPVAGRCGRSAKPSGRIGLGEPGHRLGEVRQVCPGVARPRVARVG